MLRVLDVILSGLFLLLLLPLSLFIALLAVLLMSGLPILYRGERLGRGAHVFTMLQVPDAEAWRRDCGSGPYLGEDLVSPDAGGVTHVSDAGSSATQLDEIPQFVERPAEAT